MSKSSAEPLDDVEAATLALQGMDVTAIAARYKDAGHFATPDQIRASIARGRLEITSANRAKALAGAPQAPTPAPAAPAPAPVPVPVKAKPQPAPPFLVVPVPGWPSAVDLLEIDDLLRWADGSESARARAAAAKVRAGESELRALHSRHAEAAQARADIAAAQKQLAEAKARLREIESGTKATAPATEPAPPPKAEPETATVLDPSYSPEVRAWAKANGHDVGEKGRIRGAVVDAYLAGRPTAAPAEADGGDDA